MAASQEGLSFLFEIQDKITADLIKIEKKAKASAKNIDSAFTKSSQALQANNAKVIHTEKMRGIAVESATAKATAARTKETAQGKILAQRLASAQTNEARKAANFRIAAAKRAEVSSTKAERAMAAASKARARVAIKAEKDHERALKARAQVQKKTSEASQAIARKSLFVLAGLAAALAAISVKLIALGSDAEETENVTGLAFGDMKGAAEKWAAGFAKATGSSRFESVELVSDLGLIVKGMGFTEEASLGMSSRMVELAADMASAKNVPLDVALDKIRAGLIGESEPLRTMGVLLSEARVKEEAYASGLAKTGTELTNTQKVQARMNIILADSVAMHGDLVNTQSSVANQWRAIKNRVSDAATAIGKNLLPIASEMLVTLGEWVKKGADLLTWITESEKRMKVFGAILAGVVVTGLGLAAAALWALVPAITAATGGLNLIIPLIAVGVGALVAGWILFGDTIKDFLRAVWAKMLKNIGAGLKKLSEFVGILRDDWAKAMKEAGEGLEETAAEMGKAEKATEKLAKKQGKATEATKAATGATKRATKEQIKAAKAAKKHAEMIADLGQTLQGLPTKAAIKEFEDLREAWALMETDEQKKAMDAYSDALIAAEEAGHDLDRKERAMNVTRKWTLVLERRMEEAFINRQAVAKKITEYNVKALKEYQESLEDIKKALEDEAEAVDALGRALLGLPTAAVVEDFERLRTVWEEMDEAERISATGKYAEALRKAAENGIALSDAEEKIAESTKAAKTEASGYDIALAGMAGQMGGATGQAVSLVIAMREHNKVQRAAAAAGKATEGQFSKTRIAVAVLGAAFTAIGAEIGGTTGKILTAIGNVAQAFATGGPIAAIIAGAIEVGKALVSIFSNGPSEAEKGGRQTAHSFREGIIAGLTDAQWDEVALSWKQGWDSSVIVAVRDAAMASGATFEAATALGLVMYNALHAAEKEGPRAVQRVIRQINAILDAGDAAAAAFALAAEDRARRIQAFQDEIDDIERQRIAKRLEFQLAAIEEEREAALDAMRDRHEQQLAAIAEYRSAKMEELRQGKADALALIEEEREAALDVLRGQHSVELTALDVQAAARLSALKGRHAAELTEIERARDDALSPFEKAIKDELDDAAIAVQLVVDLKKAGWDAEKIDAAKQRASEATARLEERRAIKTLMDAEEARIRAKYQPEIDRINDHYDDKIDVATTKHNIEVEEEVAYSKRLRDTTEARHAAEIKAVNYTFDAKIAAATKYFDDLITDWEKFYDVLEESTKERHEAEIQTINEHYDALIDAAKGIIRRSLAEWEQYYDDLADAARAGIAAVEAEAPAPTVDPPSIPTPTPTPTPTTPSGLSSNDWHAHEDMSGYHNPYHTFSDPYHEHFADGGGNERRQHGGPVSAGQRYKVGEAGPEMFIPSERGRIEPHGSSGGGVDAKALGRAVAESLEGMAVNVDGRKLGRLTVRHQPLAVAELGGRR